MTNMKQLLRRCQRHLSNRHATCGCNNKLLALEEQNNNIESRRVSKKPSVHQTMMRTRERDRSIRHTHAPTHARTHAHAGHVQLVELRARVVPGGCRVFGVPLDPGRETVRRIAHRKPHVLELRVSDTRRHRRRLCRAFFTSIQSTPECCKHAQKRSRSRAGPFACLVGCIAVAGDWVV